MTPAGKLPVAPPRLIVFDCDGTLVDSQGNIVAAMTAAFAAEGLTPLPREAVLDIIGLSVDEALAVLAPERDEHTRRRLAQGYKAAFHALRARGEVHEPLYHGVTELLDALERDGWLLGVATGKSDRGLGLCLSHHGIEARFVTLQTADRHPSKPDPSMLALAMAEAGAGVRETVMIGDTSYDMAMGRAAGVRTIGVTWGYHSRDMLIAAGADAVVDHPSGVGPVLDGWAKEAA